MPSIKQMLTFPPVNVAAPGFILALVALILDEWSSEGDLSCGVLEVCQGDNCTKYADLSLTTDAEKGGLAVLIIGILGMLISLVEPPMAFKGNDKWTRILILGSALCFWGCFTAWVASPCENVDLGTSAWLMLAGAVMRTLGGLMLFKMPLPKEEEQ